MCEWHSSSSETRILQFTRLDRSLEALIELAFITTDDNNAKLKCHQLVQIAAENSMSPSELSSIFNQLVFFLNASFPAQMDGQALLSQWEQCEKLASNVMFILKSYRRLRDQIHPPVLLAEVACRCSWYYYEKGQYSAAIEMAEDAISLCEHALERGNHPGYSEWFVRDMISHQVNTKTAVAKRIPTPDHGLSLAEEVLRIRESNRRELNQEDDMWIAAARGNLAVSLMAVGRDDEALRILLVLIDRPDMKSNKDVYLSNLCLCLTHLGHWEEALDCGEKARNLISSQWGEDTAQMAT